MLLTMKLFRTVLPNLKYQNPCLPHFLFKYSKLFLLIRRYATCPNRIDMACEISALHRSLLCQQSLVCDGNDPDSSFFLAPCIPFFKSCENTNRECCILGRYDFVGDHTINNLRIYVKYSMISLWNCYTGCGNDKSLQFLLNKA